METSVKLFSLNIRARNNDIVLHCTPQCLNVIRTRLGSPAGSFLRVLTYEFMEVRFQHYVGVPDERSADKAEATRVCTSLLGAYRAIVTHSLVFPDESDYRSWYQANHRPPNGHDLSMLAQRKGLFVPFLSVPFDHRAQTLTMRHRNSPAAIQDAGGRVSASSGQLAALQHAFYNRKI